MPRNKMDDLRNHLFEVIERLMDPDDQVIDVEKAKAISNAAGHIIESAKTEIQYLKLLERAGHEIKALPLLGSGSDRSTPTENTPGQSQH